MTTSILAANVVSVSVGLGFSFVAVALSVVALKAVDHWLFPTIDFTEEVKKGNVAAAVVVAGMLLFMAVVFSSALR